MIMRKRRLTMVRSVARGAALMLLLPGCVAVPDHCKTAAENRADTRPRQATLLEKFVRKKMGPPGQEFVVFIPKEASRPKGPPVIVLHEMPALSPDLLDLALRVSGEGYAVYVPLLWGGEMENAASKMLFIRRALELRASPEWVAGVADADRPILDRLESLCRAVSTRHPNQRIGVIGNCVTGVFPLALAARVPQVVAPIASQPTLPLTLSRNTQTGLSKADLARLHSRIEKEPTFQILGFRFEGDRVSSPERFAEFDREFRGRFLNYTIPLELYTRDGLKPHVHAVLTNCYSKNPKFATFHAWQECVRFLDAKLHSSRPQLHDFHKP
jgi:dienelactone hydrolase